MQQPLFYFTNMLTYLPLDIICSSKLSVFHKLYSQKTACFSEQTVSEQNIIRAHFRAKWRLLVNIYNGNWIERSASLVWNHTCDVKSNSCRALVRFWNHAYDFRPKLHDMKFNCHFITSSLELDNFIALKF